MRHKLSPHPDFPAPAITIEVVAARIGDRQLSLGYHVAGDVAAVRVPSVAEPGRADELWRHTCFEAFVAPSAGANYYEVNASPSGQWAIYRFSAYRTGMAEAGSEVRVLRPGHLADSQLGLYVDVMFGALTDLPCRFAWRLGLTAVIEAIDGSLSYWSIAHPPGRPDFHHRDCLALELAAPDGA